MRKALVIGLGSMGRRRCRLIKDCFREWYVEGVDSNSERREQVEAELDIKTWESLAKALTQNTYECAFVCTSPLSHGDIIQECLANNVNVFTELNLVNYKYKENTELAREKEKLLFLSSTMIYREEVKYIETQVDEEKKYLYSYHIGQYLPDWHPWEDYRVPFFSRKETNACREILAIELPWITRVFGEIVSVDSMCEKISDLQIDFDDAYILRIKHRNGNVGTIIVDVVACEAIRDLKIVGDHFYLMWNGEPDGLYVKRGSGSEIEQILLYDKVTHNDDYNKTIVEDEYISEMEQFFNELDGKAESLYGFEDDNKTIMLINGVEQND